jgi:hypothetical protein
VWRTVRGDVEDGGLVEGYFGIEIVLNWKSGMFTL